MDIQDSTNNKIDQSLNNKIQITLKSQFQDVSIYLKNIYGRILDFIEKNKSAIQPQSEFITRLSAIYYQLNQDFNQISIEDANSILFPAISQLFQLKTAFFSPCDAFFLLYFSSFYIPTMFSPIKYKLLLDKASSTSDLEGIFDRFLFTLNFQFITLNNFTTKFNSAKAIIGYDFVNLENPIFENFKRINTNFVNQYCLLINRLCTHFFLFFNEIVNLPFYQDVFKATKTSLRTAHSKLKQQVLQSYLPSDLSKLNGTSFKRFILYCLYPVPNISSNIIKFVEAAVNNGDLNLLRLLVLYHGLDINIILYDNESPLIIASNQDRAELINFILTLGAHVNYKNTYNNTALTLAASYGNMSNLKLLLNSGANMHMKDDLGWDSVLHAIQYGRLNCLEYLIQNGAEINTQDNLGNSSLMVSISNNRIECFQCLLEYGADVSLKNNNGYTALTFSSQSSPQFLTYLLTYDQVKFNINERAENGRTPLMLAAKKGKKQNSEILLKHNAAINLTDDSGFTALMYAAYSYEVECLELLITHGADMNHRDNIGQTALLYCLSHEDYEENNCIEYLIDQGIDVNLQDLNGLTALMLVILNEHKYYFDKIVELNNVDYNLQNSDGKTALMLAVLNADIYFINTLLSKNADPNIKDSHGDTALQIAINLDLWSIVSILEKCSS